MTFTPSGPAPMEDPKVVDAAAAKKPRGVGNFRQANGGHTVGTLGLAMHTQFFIERFVAWGWLEADPSQATYAFVSQALGVIGYLVAGAVQRRRYPQNQ